MTTADADADATPSPTPMGPPARPRRLLRPLWVALGIAFAGYLAAPALWREWHHHEPAADPGDDRFAAEVARMGGRIEQRYEAVELRTYWRRHDAFVASFERPGFSDADLRRLVDAGGDRLRGIRLADPAITGAGLRELSRLPALSTFRAAYGPARAGGPRLGDAELEVLAGLPALAFVDLSGSAVTDAGLAHVSGSRTLAHLDISRTGVRGPGLAHLAPTRSLRNLRLDGLPIDDAQIPTLAALPQVVRLDLNGTRVTAGGLAHLKDAGPSSLRAIEIHATPVAEPEMAALRSRLPGVAILRTDDDRLYYASLAASALKGGPPAPSPAPPGR